MGLLEGAWDRDAGLRHILLGGIGRWDGKGAGCWFLGCPWAIGCGRALERHRVDGRNQQDWQRRLLLGLPNGASPVDLPGDESIGSRHGGSMGHGIDRWYTYALR